jgi:SAM-dependent methyltransferase
MADQPVITNQLWPDAAAAHAAPKGDLNLAICSSCAMIWNAAFDPDLMHYAPGYENALHFSANFRNFADALAARLVAEYQLAGKPIVEIGCGDGFMLDLMAAHGVGSAIGFDPTMQGVATPFTARPEVEIVPEYFRSDQLDRPFDALLCRHVLEHLDTPAPLLADIRRAAGDRATPIYFEVPNAGWMLDAVSLWDVIYEHVGYWTAPAIETAFRRAGFAPTSIQSGYGDQFLMAEGLPATPDPAFLPANAEGVLASAARFMAAFADELTKWRGVLGHGRRAVIWGAGSKGITFANALGGDAAQSLVAMIDLNPRKHGLHIPGLGLPVRAPTDLAEIAPDVVLIANALYLDEIRDQVRGMGLTPDFDVIAG